MRHSSRDGIPIDSLQFPPGSLVPAGLLSPWPALDTFEVAWFSRALAALSEARLAEPMPGDAEAYRFLWLRSFHYPIVVRLYSTPSGGRVVAAMCSRAGGREFGTLTRRDSRALSRDEWNVVRAAIAKADFWRLPTNDSTWSGLDGAEWVFEGRRGSRYTLVHRWSPHDMGSMGVVRQLGLDFLRLGNFRLDSREIY